jgi:4-hydroxybenzoate polyprenyltransferase
MTMPLPPVVRLLRPRHWVKNLFVLAPLVFAGQMTDPQATLRAVAAAAVFTLAAVVVYVLNDLMDLERDRQHPVKSKTRPLAAGDVSLTTARIVLAVLATGIFGALLALPSLIIPVGLYLLINLAYSAGLKRVAVVDLFCVASGFLLRVYAGARVIDVPLSSWMLITTLCLALYLAAIKRRQELATRGTDGRSVLQEYSIPLLDRYAEMSGVAALLFYGLYVIEVRPRLVVTIPLVLFGLFRYWYLVEREGHGESPTEAVWNDVSLAVTVLAWGALSAYVVWAG